RKPLIRAAAVVRAPALTALREVVLLPAVLPDVGDHEVSRQPVEREAVGITEPVGPDLRPGRGAPRKRVVLRHVVAATRPGLDPQQLPQPRTQLLTPAVRVVGAASITRTDVELPVGSELDRSSVVVRLHAIGASELVPCSA